MNIIHEATADQLRTDHPEFRVGDTIKVHYLIKEGSKERISGFSKVS